MTGKPAHGRQHTESETTARVDPRRTGHRTRPRGRPAASTHNSIELEDRRTKHGTKTTSRGRALYAPAPLTRPDPHVRVTALRRVLL